MKREKPDLDEKVIRKMFRLTPHDFRRTAITRALDIGESYRRVMNASRHKSITSIQRYDLHRNAMEENSILTLNYNDELEWDLSSLFLVQTLIFVLSN